MEARAGSLTVAGLVGTGLATIGFALSGVSALGDDLQTAARQSPAPVLSPSEESREVPPAATTPAPTPDALTYEQICDREKRARAHEAELSTTPVDRATTPAREF